MRSKSSIDSAGRLVLPKHVRDALNLSPGDALDIELSADEVTLRPAKSAGLQKENGVWVLRTGEPLPQSAVDEVARRVRGERGSAILGEES
ncbi:MAG TPA: AbrB/MazE/SpoVT family DNA-binding domain-containing protein [Verrucomicrobiae bacterium]|nr:AbrB/MazE/SpoVT family DNA-binding domain-containing protein [Verrucomicrobiae bacterium]